MAKETKTHTIEVEGLTRAEALENAFEMVLNSDNFENGELRSRPEKGMTQEIVAPQKEKATYVKVEETPAFKRVYTLKAGKHTEKVESVQEARARAKELSLEKKCEVQIHLSYELVEDSSTLYGSVTYTPEVKGKWSFNLIEDIEVEDEEEMADEAATGTDN